MDSFSRTVARVAAGAIPLLFVASPVALHAQEMTVIEQKIALAKPLLIVSPEYPPDAAARARGAEIRVRGRVTTDGKLESPVYAAAAGDEAFAEAVRAVLESWRFVPGIDRDACAAVPVEAEVHVWFEIKEGKPAIFVSMPPASEYPGARAKESASGKRLVKMSRQPKPQFPRAALRRGIEGRAYVLARIEKSGEVTQPRVLASMPMPDFGEEAARAMPRATYQVFDPETWERPFVCAQMDFRFCMPLDATYRIAQCSH